MYTLVLSSRFQKDLKKITRNNPRLVAQISKTLKLLTDNIKHPSLRLHKLSGGGIWSISATESVRIILLLEEDKLYLLRIGSHDEVY